MQLTASQVSLRPPALQVDCPDPEVEPRGDRALGKVLHGILAGVVGRDMGAARGCGEREVAQPAAEVEDCARQEGQGPLLEGIELVVVGRDLALELGAEELDRAGLVDGHDGHEFYRSPPWPLPGPKPSFNRAARVSGPASPPRSG